MRQHVRVFMGCAMHSISTRIEADAIPCVKDIQDFIVHQQQKTQSYNNHNQTVTANNNINMFVSPLTSC